MRDTFGVLTAQFVLSNVVLIHSAVEYKFFLPFLFSFSDELERVAWTPVSFCSP